MVDSLVIICSTMWNASATRTVSRNARLSLIVSAATIKTMPASDALKTSAWNKVYITPFVGHLNYILTLHFQLIHSPTVPRRFSSPRGRVWGYQWTGRDMQEQHLAGHLWWWIWWCRCICCVSAVRIFWDRWAGLLWMQLMCQY